MILLFIPHTRAGGAAIYDNINNEARVDNPQIDLNAEELESLFVQLFKLREICASQISQTSELAKSSSQTPSRKAATRQEGVRYAQVAAKSSSQN